MIKRVLIRILQIVSIPVIGGFIGLILLAIAYMLPTDLISLHVQESIPMLNTESYYYSFAPTYTGSSSFDNFTEAIYMNEALINVNNTDLWDCILSNYCYLASDERPIDNLIQVFENPDNLSYSNECKRFFNGYEIIVKPLLIITDYSGIRQINIFVCISLTLLLFSLLYKRKLGQYILPVIISLVFIRPFTMSLNMTYFGFYICMIVPCICMLLLKKETVSKNAWLLFGITGTVTFFFNMNYLQLLSFGIPMMLYFIIVGIPQKITELLKTIIWCFFSWLVGLVGLMLFKWTMYFLIIDPNIFMLMKDHFMIRSGGGLSAYTRVFAINKNLLFGADNICWILAETIYIIICIIKIYVRKIKVSLSKPELVLLAIMISLPLARYYILANHVYVHSWVMHRLLLIPVLAFNLTLTKIWWNKNGSEEMERLHF